MTDKELSKFGEKLYEAILTTPLPGGTIFAIASAIRKGTPWSALPTSLKLAVFKIAANCAPETASGGPYPASAAAPVPPDQQRDVLPRAADPDSDPARPAALVEGEVQSVERAEHLELEADEADEVPAPEAA